jgi:hypothetical protein
MPDYDSSELNKKKTYNITENRDAETCIPMDEIIFILIN